NVDGSLSKGPDHICTQVIALNRRNITRVNELPIHGFHELFINVQYVPRVTIVQHQFRYGSTAGFPPAIFSARKSPVRAHSRRVFLVNPVMIAECVNRVLPAGFGSKSWIRTLW